MSSRLFRSFFVVLSMIVGSRSEGAAPVVDYLYPAGGQQGQTVTFKVGAAKGEAKIAPWPASIHCESKGLKFEPDKASGSFTATIASDCAPGPHLIHIYNADGVASPRVFVVGRHAELLEKTGKGETPQTAEKLPAVLNGRLDKRDESDSWAIDVEAGKWIVAELECRRLGSPIDPTLRLLDPDGNAVAFNHDVYGLDPLIAYQPSRSGRYVLQIAGFVHPPGSEVRFAGSAANVYRLNVTTGPYARYAIPAFVPAGAKTPVKLFGWNLPGTDTGLAAEVEQADNGSTKANVDLDNVIRFPQVVATGRLEAEPNDKQPQEVQLPAAIDGRLQQVGDVDRFSFAAKKNDRLTISLRTSEVFSPIDPVITITGSDGSQLAREDDTGGVAKDPRLDWKAPADGQYIVAVSDLSRGGGPECVYRLQIGQTAPDFAVTAEAASLALQPGKTAELKLKVVRTGGHDTALKAVVNGLPKGVTAKPIDVPAKATAVTITLSAEASAEAANIPLQVSLSDGKLERPAQFVLGADQMIEQTSVLWLTVGSAAKPADDKPKK